jgi:uncharacterized protein YukE
MAMSEPGTTGHDGEELADRSRSDEQIAQLVERVDSMESRIAELEAENEDLRSEVDQQQALLEAVRKGMSRNAATLFGDADSEHSDKQEQFIERHGAIVDQLMPSVDGGVLEELRSDLRDRLHGLGSEFAGQYGKLRRRLVAVEEETGVDIDEADVIAEDRIRTVLKHGPEEVEGGSASAKHHRATDVLRNVNDWGNRIRNDGYGDRFVLDASKVKQHLNDKRDETLQSVQVTRAFEAIVEWAKDSDRDVTMKRGSRGDSHKLRIQLEGDR